MSAREGGVHSGVDMRVAGCEAVYYNVRVQWRMVGWHYDLAYVQVMHLFSMVWVGHFAAHVTWVCSVKLSLVTWLRVISLCSCVM